VCQVAGVNQEVRRLRQIVDFVDGEPQGSVYVGVGRSVESNVAIADLDELKSFGAAVVTKQGTPPVMVQATPEPAQAMQRRKPRRSMPSELLRMSVMKKASACHDCLAGILFPEKVGGNK